MAIFTSIFIMMIFVFIVLGGINAAAKNKKINNNRENKQNFENKQNETEKKQVEFAKKQNEFEKRQQEMLEKHYSDDIEKLKQMREYLDSIKTDDEFASSDKMEEELMQREGFENVHVESKSHDQTCFENDCDGCGSEDVYAQVYGKRKKNKIKKK